MTGNTHNTANTAKVKNIGLPEGITLGHYKLLHVLGQGGFGITYLAVDQRTNAQVVIKENLPTFYAVRDDASLQVQPLAVADAVQNYAHTLQRFVEEARILAHLNHPNIVRVHEAFEALGTAYYVMPYIEAKELHKVIPTEAVDEAWLLPILKAVLSALDYLHSKNLLHRDLKPGNILLQADGTPILIDFGTARALQTERSATMMGTPGYTPIEQITPHGKRGPWMDLYALGATCYRLITGQLPPQAVERIEDEDPYLPLASRAELRARFSLALLSSIDKALAIRSKDRWQSAQEWAAALATPAAPRITPRTTPLSTEQTPEAPVASTGSGKKPLTLILCLLGVLLLGGGYGVYAYLDAVEQERVHAEYALAEAGVAKDGAEAVKWYRKAAEQGDAAGQYNLGTCYLNGNGVAKDGAEAVKWYRKAAEQGHADGQNQLGYCYHLGIGVAMDGAEAVKWYRKAAEQGHAMGQYNLGTCYHLGNGVAKDGAEAVKWYRKAAEQGHADGQNNLGTCYQNGIGVAKDGEEAVKWYRKAAEQGHAWGQNNLGYCYRNGIGVAKDGAEAVKWYRKAAEQGHALGQNNLGYCYEKGIGVAKDGAEAVKWYRKAAEQGHADGQNGLGYCYEHGIGVAKDEAEAVKWYRKAAEQGYATSQNWMGYCYENGHGVAKDRTQAIEWYRKAARQGNEYAQTALKRLGQKW